MFFEFGIKDFIDILLVAFLLYYTYKLMKASGSINVFTGILVFILIWLVVSQVLEMKLLGSIFDKLVSVGVLALIVLFQDEIRRFLLTLGSHQHASALVRFFTGNKKEGMEHDEIMPVVMACISMGKQKVGALIVVEHNMPLDDVVRTGEIINADINQRLIENIFSRTARCTTELWLSARNALRRQDVSCPCRIIWIFRKNWACGIVRRWEYLRCRMPMRSLYRKKQALFR